jgi:peptide/nickel transport system permease protein
MGRIPLSYLTNRLVTLFLTVFVAATLIWIVPRLSPIDPIDVMLGRMAAGGGSIENSEAILQQLRESFGFDQPLFLQYLYYIVNSFTLDFGISTASFPTPVSTMIGYALPWTIGLMLISLIITFIIGNLLGALMVVNAEVKFPRSAEVIFPTFGIW